MKKYKALIIFLIIVFCIVVYFVIRNFQLNSVSYQMKKLESGSTGQKIVAADFMGENKINDAIPLLIQSIDNDDRDFWSKEPKSGRIKVSCVVTYALSDITNLDFGNTCDEYSKTEEDDEAVKQAWKDWYNDEYNK